MQLWKLGKLELNRFYLFACHANTHTHTPTPCLHQEQTISPTNTLTQQESTVIALEGGALASLSSAELWRKPIEDTEKERANYNSTFIH